MARKLVLASLGVLGLVAVVATFLLGTTAGLRLVLDQALTRSGAPVEIDAVRGRILGGVALSGVSYRNPEDGVRVRVDTIELDWRPAALLGGRLHITHLHTSGVEYTPGQSAESPDNREASIPDVPVPLAIRIDEFQLEGFAIADGAGSIRTIVRNGSLRAALDADGALFTDVSIDAGGFSIEGGRIRAGFGTGMPLEASLGWRAARPGHPDISGHLVVDGTLTGTLASVIEVEAPLAARGRGTIDNLLATPRWDFQASVPEPVGLDALFASLPPVSVRGDVRIEGDAASSRVTPDLSLEYNDNRMTLTGEVDVSTDAVVIRRARLARPEGPDTVNLSGRIAFKDHLPFRLSADWQSLHGPENAPWASPSGRLTASGNMREATATLSGSINPPGQEEATPISVEVTTRDLDTDPRVSGSAHSPRFFYAGIDAHDIAADIEYRAADDADSNVVLTAARLRLAGREASGVALRASGAPSRHQASLSGNLDGWAVKTTLAGSYGNGRWTAELEQLTAESPDGSGLGKWALAAPADLAWSPSRSEVAALCLENEGARLCADGSFAGQGDWQATAGLTGLPLQQLAVNAPQALGIDGTLEADMDIEDRGGGLTGDARATVQRATVTWDAGDSVTTTYRDVVATASLNPDVLRATLEGRVDESGSIQGELVTRTPLADDGEIQGSISAELPSLRVIQAAVPALGLRQGTARLALRVDGTRSAPQLSGDGRIADAVLDVAPLGIQLNDLRLDLSTDDSRRLEITARAESGEGSLSADGYIEWPADGGWQGEVQVRGDQAELVRTPRALIHGSPDLRVAADESGGTVSGRIPITRAELTPESGRPGVAISDDFVIKGADEENEATRNPLAWHAKVTIELGDHTRFRGYGMKARLSGALDIDAPPGQPTRANGSIQIHDGEYTLYGRTFNIGQGRLVYTGGPVGNPGIDVEVVKDVRDVSVSMSITGQLADPALRLSSTPAMSETDQMSYLLLGRPASQASDAEAGLLLQAAASLLPGGGGSGVPRYIQSTLGLDTLDIRTDSAETEGAAVEVGKYLGPDLYVSYIAGFQQGVDIFRVRYELARHWLLQAESTTRGSGGDVLFTW